MTFVAILFVWGLGVFVVSMVGLFIYVTSVKLEDRKLGAKLFFCSFIWPVALSVVIISTVRDMYVDLRTK